MVVVCLSTTRKFSVLEPERLECNIQANNSIPIVGLQDLLLHEQSRTTTRVRSELQEALSKQGFCLLSMPNGSRPARVIDTLRHSLTEDLFPREELNPLGLEAAETVYISEKGVPMYRLGYELCEDGVRQVFRISASQPDNVAWPNATARSTWLQALALMRHVTDTALQLLVKTPAIKRPYAGGATWCKDRFSQKIPVLRDREGDFSVLYAMHYFNTNKPEHVSVKAHVDPSLLVLEPFLCRDTAGLQVWDRHSSNWMDCDGPASGFSVLDGNQQYMLLFAGKALGMHAQLEPTLHRVVTGDKPRRTVIYEQKYEEFFPAPILD